jgi:hypothetical protein
MQHLHDEDLEPRKVRAYFEIEPPQAWYYRIFSNFRTLVILFQVDRASGDEPEIVCEGCYETEHFRMVFSSQCWKLLLVVRSNSSTTS